MRTGAEFNVVKDKNFDLPLLRLVPEAKRFISDQLEERTTLESDGRFHTYPEYPEFAWVESITNAVCHRQWGLRGDYILVSKYDDRLEIKSPGRLPNIVTVDNIFTTRFARNPLISRVLTEMELVRELNEGIPRVFKEMKEAGLPEPKIVETAANVTVILYNEKAADGNSQTTESATQTSTQKTTLTTTQRVLELMEKNPYITIDQIAASIGITRDGVNYQIKKLKNLGQIERDGGDYGGKWKVIKK